MGRRRKGVEDQEGEGRGKEVERGANERRKRKILVSL